MDLKQLERRTVEHGTYYFSPSSSGGSPPRRRPTRNFRRTTTNRTALCGTFGWEPRGAGGAREDRGVLVGASAVALRGELDGAPAAAAVVRPRPRLRGGLLRGQREPRRAGPGGRAPPAVGARRRPGPDEGHGDSARARPEPRGGLREGAATLSRRRTP